MKISLREQAIDLRKKGWSYNIISERLGVAKSTLSHWLRNVHFTPNKTVRKRMNEAWEKSAKTRHDLKKKSIQDAKNKALRTIDNVSKRDLMMLGLGLYIGEGMKLYETTRVSNSDPLVIKCLMRWFREVLEIPNKHFRGRVHIYPDIDEKEALTYWSRIAKIPLTQFGKCAVDKRTDKSRTKRRKLPYGTMHVTVNACSDPKFGSLMHRYIIGLIEASLNQKKSVRV